MIERTLLATIFGIAALFGGLTLLIIAGKVWREARERFYAGRRGQLEPAVLDFAQARTETLEDALGRRLGNFDRHALEGLLLDHAQRVRGEARERLSRALARRGFVAGYLQSLRSKRWWRRAEAAERLGLAGSPDAMGPLVRAMRDEVPEVRIRAAKALGAIGGSVSTGVLIEALDRPDRWSTIRVADILSGMGPVVIGDLQRAFRTLSAAGKLAALDVIGRIRALESSQWLVEQLDDLDSDVRARAAHALGRIGDPVAVPALIESLRDGAWPVRAMAAKALGRIGDARALIALCAAVGDPAWWVRSNAAQALREMGPTGRAALEGLLHSPDRFVRHQAIVQLQELGIVDSRAAELVSSDPIERARAERLIRSLVQEGQTGRLESLAEEHADEAVRCALRAELSAASEAQESR